eukprot:5087097-Amphidinium_carterae.1
MVNGIWVRPIFARATHIDLEDGRRVPVKSGTQTIDGFWTHLRSYVVGNPAHGAELETLDSMVRLAQYHFWAGGQDPVAQFASTLSG